MTPYRFLKFAGMIAFTLLWPACLWRQVQQFGMLIAVTRPSVMTKATSTSTSSSLTSIEAAWNDIALSAAAAASSSSSSPSSANTMNANFGPLIEESIELMHPSEYHRTNQERYEHMILSQQQHEEAQNAEAQSDPTATYFTSRLTETSVSSSTANNKIYKTHFDPHLRFLFIAGLGGTGHHGWQVVLNNESNTTNNHAKPICHRAPADVEQALVQLWWDTDDSRTDVHGAQLQQALQRTKQQVLQNQADDNGPILYCLNTMAKRTMFSYPKGNSPRHHPNLVNLALLAESVGIDLRILVIHRAPTNQIVSLSIHRHYFPLPAQAQQMSNQAALLNAQLQALDDRFFMCTAYTQVPQNRHVLQDFVVGGMVSASASSSSSSPIHPFGLAEAIAQHYHVRPENEIDAWQRIWKYPDGRRIVLKMNEMILYRQILQQSICPSHLLPNKDGEKIEKMMNQNQFKEQGSAASSINLPKRESFAMEKLTSFNATLDYWLGTHDLVTNKAQLAAKVFNVAALHETNQQRARQIAPASSAKQSLVHSYQVAKTYESDSCRFVFVAGLDGTGHDQWEKVLASTSNCERSLDVEDALYNLWWGKDKFSDQNAMAVQSALQKAKNKAHKEWKASGKSTVYCLNAMSNSTHFAYPGYSTKSQRHHPNVYSLALLAEAANVDLRILVLHRPAPVQLASLLSRTEQLHPISVWAQLMTNQAAMLNSQLGLLDPSFFLCTETEEVLANRYGIQDFLFGDMKPSSSSSSSSSSNSQLQSQVQWRNAISKHFWTTKSDQDILKATQAIKQQTDGVHISLKIDEMEMYRNHLSRILCQQDTQRKLRR